MITSFRIGSQQGNGVSDNYDHVSGGIAATNTSESVGRITYRINGAFILFRLVVESNSASTSNSSTLFKNGSSTSLSITIPAGTTGEFSVSGNVSVNSGDTFSIHLNRNSVTVNTNGKILVFKSNNSLKSELVFGQTRSATYNSASTTFFIGVGRTSSPNTNEAFAQTYIDYDCTIKNFYVRVTSNARSSTTTLRTRINGSNGNLSISVPSSTTGVFEDTSNTDNITAGDLFNFSLTTGSGTGDFVTLRQLVTSESTKYYYGGTGGTINFSLSSGQTVYIGPFAGNVTNNSANSLLTDWSLNCIVSKTRGYVETNTTTSSSTVKFYKNGSAGNQSISIPSSTTGWFSDLSNTDSVSKTDQWEWQIVNGGGGTLAINHLPCMVETLESGLTARLRTLVGNGL